MTIDLNRVFFDTNVYMIGAADPNSYESRLLQRVGFGEEESGSVEVVVSEELFDQILRVAKRLRNKDWGGELLGRIWQNLNVCYVLLIMS
jgi:hypothetical protein